MANRSQRGICRRLAWNPRGHGVGTGGGAGPVHAASAASAAATSEPRFVREAQRTLGDPGFRPGPIDGVVGRRTQDALARYQRSEGIPVTGHLDAETLVRLDIHRRVSPAGDRREGEPGGPPGAARPALTAPPSGPASREELLDGDDEVFRRSGACSGDASKPASMIFCRSSVITDAVIAMIGIARVVTSARIRLSASTPSIPGSRMSMRTRARPLLEGEADTLFPVSASMTPYPLNFSTSRTSFRFFSWSSTMRISSFAMVHRDDKA